MALLQDFGVDGGGILQPRLKNRWALEFVGIDPVSGMRVQAIQTDKPKREFEEVVLDRYNSKAYVAGKHIWQPITVTFEDDTGGLVASALQQQTERQELITGAGPALRLPASPSGALYKFGIRMTTLDGGDEVYETWNISGAWIQNLDYQDLDYAVSESVKVTCVFRFDHAQQIITGADGLARQALGGQVL